MLKLLLGHTGYDFIIFSDEEGKFLSSFTEQMSIDFFSPLEPVKKKLYPDMKTMVVHFTSGGGD